MDKEQNYNHILDELLVGTDMDNEVSCKMAYNACIAYAEQDLDADFKVNTFIALAAERLSQTHIHFAVIKGMVPMPEDARLHLKYAPQGGPVLTGNTEGLRYLSDLCAALSDSPLPEGAGPEEHVHLYNGEPPMIGNSYGLTLYHSSDSWFDHHAAASEEPDADTDNAAENSPPREITSEQIVAIEFFEDGNIPMPPPFYLRYDKVYRVLKSRLDSLEEEVWTKPPASGEGGRMHVFTIRDDAQEIFEIALDLDDAGIHYFTHSDLEQVWGANTQ